MGFEVIDVPASEIRSANNLMEWIRANAIQRILLESIEATHDNNHLDSLEMAVYYLHQNFSVHHSEEYLEKVKELEDKLLAKPTKKDPREIRKAQAKLFLDWYGLINRFLFPHEGIGEIKEGIMRRGFYEDKLLLEFEEKERKKFEKAKKQFAEQSAAGKSAHEVKFDV